MALCQLLYLSALSRCLEAVQGCLEPLKRLIIRLATGLLKPIARAQGLLLLQAHLVPLEISCLVHWSLQVALASSGISKQRLIGATITYRVEEDHSFVHDLEVVCHVCEIVAKFIDEMVDFHVFNLDDEAVWQLGVLG